MLLILPLLAGCQLALKDGVPTQEPVKFEGPGEGCMDSSLLYIQKFFSGDGVPEEIDQAWTCLSGSLKTFETHVRGEDPHRYSARELRDFIQRFFLKEQKISDALLTECMRIKQVILGGDLQYVTKEELKQTYVLFDTFRVESKKMAPYMKILGMEAAKPKNDAQRAYIERGIHQTVSSARIIGSQLGRSFNSYHLQDMATFLREFGKLYSGDKTWKGPDKLIEQLPTVATLKSFFLRPTGNSIAPDEWQELVAKAARLFSLYIRTSYLFPEDLTSGEGLRQVSTFTSDFFVILDESVRAKDNKIIEYTQINNLIDRLYKMEVFKFPVSQSVAKDVVKTLFDKLTNPSVEGKRDPSYGITDKTLLWLKRDFFGWSEIQAAWDEMQGGKEMTVGTLRQRFKGLSFANKDSFEELSMLINRPHPVVLTDDGTIVLERPAESQVISRKAWTKLNMSRTLIRIILRGFSADHTAQKFTGLTRPEYERGFEELRPVLEAMDVVDQGDTGLRDSLFDEANLFMMSADSNNTISYNEGIEILWFVFSGLGVADKIEIEGKDKCKQVGRNRNGDPMLDRNCYVKLLETNSDRYFKHLPHWTKKMNENKGEKWEKFAKTILRAIRGDSGLTPISMGEITETVVILQYIESLFLRFDTDKSGTLNLSESMVAYPLLYKILKEQSKFEDDKDVEALFTYLLRYGEAPDDDLDNIVKWLLWKNKKGSWKYEADRKLILQVVANLKKDVAEDD